MQRDLFKAFDHLKAFKLSDAFLGSTVVPEPYTKVDLSAVSYVIG